MILYQVPVHMDPHSLNIFLGGAGRPFKKSEHPG